MFILSQERLGGASRRPGLEPNDKGNMVLGEVREEGRGQAV